MLKLDIKTKKVYFAKDDKPDHAPACIAVEKAVTESGKERLVVYCLDERGFVEGVGVYHKHLVEADCLAEGVEYWEP